MNTATPGNEPGIRQRLKVEIRAYIVISGYLWICFTALLLYQNAVLDANHGHLLPMSVAAIKALVLGKFLMVGKAFRIGETTGNHRLLNRIVVKSLAMLLLLLVFTGVEEFVLGFVHGHTLAAIVGEFADRPWIEVIAPAAVMLLVLIPMIAFEEIDTALGRGSLLRILLSRPGS